MVSETLGETAVKEIQANPAKFVYEQFAEGGAFQRSAISRSSLDSLPVILRVRGGERAFLDVTVWECSEEDIAYSVYEAVRSGGKQKQWDHVSTTLSPYTILDPLEEYGPMVAREAATMLWGQCKSAISCPKPLHEAAWFFPWGLEEAVDDNSMILYTSNIDTKEA